MLEKKQKEALMIQLNGTELRKLLQEAIEKNGDFVKQIYSSPTKEMAFIVPIQVKDSHNSS